MHVLLAVKRLSVPRLESKLLFAQSAEKPNQQEQHRSTTASTNIVMYALNRLHSTAKAVRNE